MSNNELAAKLALTVAVLVGIVALGSVIIFAVAPIFVAASIIDFFYRQKYNEKLDAIKGSDELDQGPSIKSFDARLHEGRVIVAWFVDLPGNAQLDVYRLTGTGGGAIEEIVARGTCVISTGREMTENMSEAFYDDGLPEGVYYYVPVASGMRIKKEPISYSFLSFARELQFSTRRRQVTVRGEAVAVHVADARPKALPDTRNDVTRLADDVLAQFESRKKFDAELDAAIARITESSDLTEEEKAEAIELMETRAASI